MRRVAEVDRPRIDRDQGGCHGEQINIGGERGLRMKPLTAGEVMQKGVLTVDSDATIVDATMADWHRQPGRSAPCAGRCIPAGRRETRGRRSDPRKHSEGACRGRLVAARDDQRQRRERRRRADGLHHRRTGADSAQGPRPHAPTVNASATPSRAPPHDSGPVWVVSPSLCDSFIHNTMPV